MTGERWRVYWNEYAANTYLYGSEIFYHDKRDIEFKNILMPPGTVIREWFSRTNYQLQRIEPSLPMIDGEGKYQIEIHMDCPAEESFLMRLVFYDKYEEEAGSITLREPVTEFRCPLKTYSYKLQLINGGMTTFHFHYVEIREITDETDRTITQTE